MNIEDVSELLPYLRAHHLIQAGETPVVRLLNGGVSSRTVWVEAPGRPAFVLKQSLERLRVEVDWFSSPDRIHAEACGMRCLHELAPPGSIVSLLHEDFSEHIIAMAAVPHPHCTWKELLLTTEPRLPHFQQFATILGQIHARSAGNHSLARQFSARAQFELLRLEPYYRYCAVQIPAAARFLNMLIEETLRQRLSLVHGDYSPKNILVYQNRFVLLDHEVIHYGDPAFDVGFSLTHLLAKALHVAPFRSELIAGARQYVGEYRGLIPRTRFGAGFEARACRHTLACLLARVAGRSPLEYLGEKERRRLQEFALACMPNPPSTLIDLISEFAEGL